MNRTSQRNSDPGGSFVLHGVVFLAVFVTCCWPYLIWHSEDQYGRMQWDTSSWAACIMWWISVAVIVAVARACSPSVRTAKTVDKELRELEKLRMKSSAPWRMYRDPQELFPSFRSEDLRAHALKEEVWLG